jgi:predicted dehydrogenase
MAAPLRIGVIGAGAFASRRHIPDILRSDEMTLAAICRRDAETLDRLARRFAPERSYADWQHMLDDCPLDVVVIATPNHLHFPQAAAALKKGLHVLLEKPMTVTVEEARMLRDLARERELQLAVAYNPPYWAHCHAIRRAIHGGEVGEIESVGFFWSGNSDVVFGAAPIPTDMPGPVVPTLFRADPAQCGGGAFMDGGAHLVSEILWTTGLRATRVTCLMDQSPTDRRAALSLTLENGAIATICSVSDSRAAGRRVRNTFGGSKGAITVEGFDFLTTIQPEDAEAESFKEADLAPVPGPIANLVDAIRHQSELFGDSDHGVYVQEVLAAAYQSAATRQAVTINPVSAASV